MDDRKRTDTVKGKKVTFHFLEPDNFTPIFDKVTSVAVIPFDKNGHIVTAILDRGFDIPGGHVKIGEKTIEETARRESSEEAFITLKDLYISTIIQSDFYGIAEKDLTYMVIMTGLVNRFNTIEPNEESSGRKILTPNSFIEHYTAGNKNQMKQLILDAQKIAHGKFNIPILSI